MERQKVVLFWFSGDI